MTKRVCLVGPVYPYRGGIAHYGSMLAREFARDCEVLVVNFARLYPSFLFPGKTQFDESGEPLDVPSTRVVDSLNPISFWRAARIIKDFEPDLIVFQWWQPFFAIAYSSIVRLIGRRLRKQVVFVCHNVLPHERSLVDTVLIRMAFVGVGRFLVQSREDGDNLRQLKKDALLRVHPLPIFDIFNLGRYTTESARRETGVDGHVILFFGLIRPYKGIGVLFEAFAEVVKQLDATLLVVGEFYENREPYMKRLTDLGLADRVRVVDRYVPNEDVEKYFRSADLVVLPYLSATQSGITQIAFSFDKPVVVTDVGGLPDVVDDGVTGYIVPPNDPQALAQAIVAFFTEGKATAMSAAIAQAKTRFSWKSCREILAALGEASS